MRSLLFLPDPGTALQVRRKSLCVRTNAEETLIAPRAHGFRTIVMAGHGVSITGDAIRWAAREHVALYLMSRAGEAFSIIGEAVEADNRRAALAIRQKQFAAVLDPRKRFVVANKIVAAKLRTLGLDPADARGFRAELARATKLEDIMTAEARAGAAYFMRFRGAEIRFKGTGSLPDHWRVFAARAGSPLKGRGGTSKARHAATPFGAMLNYTYGVALGQCARACVGLGLDPSFGFLHSPKPGRLSLAYDVLELHRAACTGAVFGYAAGRVFQAADFEMSDHGIVSLGPVVARDIATLAIRAVPIADCIKSMKQIVRWF